MEEKRHSGLGIASFIISILSAVMVCLILFLAGMMETSTPTGLSEDSVGTLMLVLLFFAFLLASLIALGLGIGGLIKKNRKRIFAILGTVFSSVTLVGTMILILVGMSVA